MNDTATQTPPNGETTVTNTKKSGRLKVPADKETTERIKRLRRFGSTRFRDGV